LYSRSDEALWLAGDSFGRMGPRFRQQAGDSYVRLVRDYPLSGYVAQAKSKLKTLEVDVPEADPAAVARMKYEAANRKRAGLVHKSMGFLRRGPEVASAARSGSPQMNNPKQNIPASVPVPGATAGFSGDVTAAPVTDSTALDNNPDARAVPPAATNGKQQKKNQKPQ